MTVLTEAKRCPYCEKPLRRDNTRGACSNCLAKGADKKAARGADEALPVSRKPRAKVARRPTGDVMEQVKEFLDVTLVLGVDGEQLLSDFTGGWLQQVREKAKTIFEEA